MYFQFAEVVYEDDYVPAPAECIKMLMSAETSEFQDVLAHDILIYIFLGRTCIIYQKTRGP